MRRPFIFFVLSLSLLQGAIAQENAQTASETSAQDTTQQDPKAHQQASHKISELITRKFGVAREKAQTANYRHGGHEFRLTYSFPPVLLLAIISIESRFKETAKGSEQCVGAHAGRAVAT